MGRLFNWHGKSIPCNLLCARNECKPAIRVGADKRLRERVRGSKARFVKLEIIATFTIQNGPPVFMVTWLSSSLTL